MEPRPDPPLTPANAAVLAAAHAELDRAAAELGSGDGTLGVLIRKRGSVFVGVEAFGGDGTNRGRAAQPCKRRRRRA